MNRRIISKILRAKYEALVDSISDEQVKTLVRKNAMITGGSIVSLLTGETVKDFDFYFRSLETVKAVADYYVAEFVKLNPKVNVKPEVREEGARVRIRIKSAGITSETEEGNKYEYFETRPDGEGQDYVDALTDTVSDQTATEEEEEGKPKYRPVFLSDNAITLSNKCQLVIRFWGEPDEVHKNYDFVHCTNFWTAWDGKLVLRPAAMESILAKELYYIGSLYPLCSVIRTRKFLKRGWHINAGQFLKMCFQISLLNLSDINVLQEQLTGVDAAYFMEIIDYCKARQEQEPDFKVTMPYLCTIVDKIFGKCED
jgi:hypothetical protein